MVHKIIDGSKKEVKDELQMYVTEARFMLSRPAASVDLKTFATLPFIQSIDPSIKHEAIKPSDVSTLKDEKGQNNKNPDRAWCEGTGVTACIRSSYKLEGKLPIGVALANKIRDSERKLSDTIEFESEMRLLSASDVDEAGLRKLTGVDTPVAGVLEQNMFYVNQVMRFGKLVGGVPAQPGRRQEHHHHRGDRACGRLQHARTEEEVRERAGAAEPGAVAGAARQQLVQRRQFDQRRPAELRPQPHQGDCRDFGSRLIGSEPNFNGNGPLRRAVLFCARPRPKWRSHASTGVIDARLTAVSGARAQSRFHLS